MKKNILIKFLFIFLLPIMMLVGCEEEIGEEIDPKGTGTDFETLTSSYDEADGTGTVTIALRNGSISESDISLSGTAIEGVDYEVVSVSGEGVQISIIDDDSLEVVETVKVIINNATGNNVHTVYIYSNCEDILGLDPASFKGSWAALEDYGEFGTFGPYNVTLVQDATDPNKFKFSNFYGSGATYTAYLVLDIPTGTVKFPDQTVGAPTYNRGPITLSSGTFDLCTAKRTMDITLFYDGLQWDYHFTKN